MDIGQFDAVVHVGDRWRFNTDQANLLCDEPLGELERNPWQRITVLGIGKTFVPIRTKQQSLARWQRIARRGLESARS